MYIIQYIYYISYVCIYYMIYNYTYTIHDTVILRTYEIEIILILEDISTHICEEPHTVRMSVKFQIGTIEEKTREDSFQIQGPTTMARNFLKAI